MQEGNFHRGLSFSAIRLNYLFVDQYTFPSTWVYPLSAIPYSMLRLIERGTALFTVDGEDLAVREGQVVHIPQGCSLACRATSDEFTFISVRFTSALPLDERGAWPEGPGISRITECADPEIRRYFRLMVEARKSASEAKMFRLKGYLELIAAYLVDESAKRHAVPAGDSPGPRPGERSAEAGPGSRHAAMPGGPVLKLDTRVQGVVEYLTMHPFEGIDMDRMCALTELSPSSLRRLFKEHTGKSPTEFVMDMRMMAAARRLLATDDRVSAIAYDLGFSDPNYFVRRFRENFGTSPGRYRDVSRE